MTRALYTLDPSLEEALNAVRAHAARVRTGRVYLELHQLAGVTVDYRVTEDTTTEWEVERVMRERPRKMHKRVDEVEEA